MKLATVLNALVATSAFAVVHGSSLKGSRKANGSRKSNDGGELRRALKDDGGGGSVTLCFTGDSTVLVENHGLVAMEDLKVGDSILTGENNYQPVYAFGHYKPTRVAEFLYIETQVPFEPLKITGEHLVYVQGKPHPVRADSLQVGDFVVRASSGKNKVTNRITSITTFVGKGMYAPLTPSGNLVVNGMMASSYVSLQDDQSEFVEFPVVGIAGWTQQDYVHWTLAPFRVFCGGVSTQLCQMYDDEGIPYYISWGMKAVRWAHHYGGIVEIVFLFFALVLFAACRLVELTVGGDMGRLAFGAALSVALWNKYGAFQKVKTL